MVSEGLDDNWRDSPVVIVCPYSSQALHNLHPRQHSPENRMALVQRWRRRQRNEELTPVRIRATISHAQNTRSRMLQIESNRVLELLAVDRAAASACARRIPGLEHEVGDDAVEEDVCVVAPLHERLEVGAGFRGVGFVELDYYCALRGMLVDCVGRRREHTMVVSRAIWVVILRAG